MTISTLVIGAGPAGVACAIWLHQLGLSVELVDKNSGIGGLQLCSPYENAWVPGLVGLTGQEIAKNLENQLIHKKINYQAGNEVLEVLPLNPGFKVNFADGTSRDFAHVVLATGAKFKKGPFISSASVAIGPGVDIEGRNVSGKRIAILGGGDNAFDQYLFAKKRGAAVVKIFARTLRAQQKLKVLVPPEDVILGNFQVDSEKVTVNDITFDLLHVLFGFEPVIPLGLENLARNEKGFVIADLWGQTSITGVYAVGEVAQTFHPCVTTSFAHGIQAAKAIQRTLGL